MASIYQLPNLFRIRIRIQPNIEQLLFNNLKSEGKFTFGMASTVKLGLQGLDREAKSREYLAALLGDQIEKNQALESENCRLEVEQRKLIELLERKTKEITNLRTANNQRERSKSKREQPTPIPSSPSQSLTKNPNESTTIIHNSTFNDANNESEVMTMLKTSLQEKEDEMKRMREYYGKCLEKVQGEREGEIQEYRGVVGRLKARIKELMEALERLEEQKSAIQAENAKLKARKLEPQTPNQSHLQQLQQLQQAHQTQILAIEQYHSEQTQTLLHSHSQQLQTIQANTIYKMQQLQQKLQKQQEAHLRELEDKERRIGGVEGELYGVQGKLRDALLRVQEQCEIVMNIQADRERLGERVGLLEEQLRQAREEKKDSENSRVNIDNIHKQYTLKLQTLEHSQSQSQSQILQLQSLLQQKAKQCSTLQQKLQQTSKKSTGQLYQLEKQQKQLKETVQQLKEEVEFLEKENKLKEEDNRRLAAKIGKDSEKKEQYIRKLEEKVGKLEGELAEVQHNEKEKQQDIIRYKEEMANFVAKMKEELGRKDRELAGVLKENERKSKQMKEFQEKNEYALATLNNQFQEASKKYAAVCDKLRTVDQEKGNYKHLYEDSLKQAKNLQQKRKKLTQQVQKLSQTNEKLEQQIEYLKEQILSHNLTESEKEELAKLRNQAYDQKARMNKLNQNLGKIKEENQRLMRENLGMEENLVQMQGQNTKLMNQLQMKKERVEECEERIAGLEEDLKRRCKELETSMPYLNKVIEEKKANQLQLQKRNNEIKKLISLVQLAKKSKAEQIVNLTRELQSTGSKLAQLESELKDNKNVIERFNRQKVNMLRENTVREDMLKKLEKQNKVLKENLVESQENVEKLMHYMGIADSAMESVELEQSYSKRGQRR